MTRPTRLMNEGTTPIADPERWQWADGAACAGLPLWLFYGHEGERESETLARETAAKAVCGICPLHTYRACREVALNNSAAHQHGVQAGMSADERIRVRRSRQRAAQPARQKGAA